jgi:hypothetical protein
MKNTSWDFSQNYQSWEMAVFAERVVLVVSHHLGGSHWHYKEFPAQQLQEATVAVQLPTCNGKPRILYACNKERRQIVLDRRDHALWLTRAGL